MTRIVWLIEKNSKTKLLPERKRPHMAHYPSRPRKRRCRYSRRATKADTQARQTALVLTAVLLLLIFLY